MSELLEHGRVCQQAGHRRESWHEQSYPKGAHPVENQVINSQLALPGIDEDENKALNPGTFDILTGLQSHDNVFPTTPKVP